MRKYLLIFLIISFSVVGIIIWQGSYFNKVIKNTILQSRQTVSAAVIVNSPFQYNFQVDSTLDEAGEMNESLSPYWWVNSGGYMYLRSGIGKTVQGELPKYNKWRLLYSISNSLDTDNGYHPQNIFRMPTRSKWQDFRQEAYFKINKDNLSASPNRNASNGLLLFNRYQDSNNLYYTGVRVDGAAVIKKKINGVYYTMAYKPFFGTGYNRDTNPNLLPKNVWIGLRSEVKTNTDGTVNIKVYVDNGKTGNWVLGAEATDDGKSFGNAVIGEAGYAGIRTDFMDVEFDDFRLTILN